MQSVKINNDLFSPNNVKCFAVNNFASNSDQRNFMNSIQKAHNTLGCLERSMKKSNEYEQKLLQCKGSHRHSHHMNEWWDSDHSEEKSFKRSYTTSTSTNNKTSNSKLSWSHDFTDTWSSMSIVCLQYKYEELAKRYRDLMQGYNELCNAVGMRDKRLEQWQERVNSSHSLLERTHTALLAVGEKYLALRDKKKVQKKWYEDQLMGMRQSLQDMMDATTRARMKFDARLESCMSKESDSDAALLLYEIRKCNLLFLENLQLKAVIEDLIPGQVKWTP